MGYDLEEQENFELQPGELQVSESPEHYISDISHRYEYSQTVHGYETDNHISVGVSARTGHVSGLNNNYDPDLEFEEPEKVLDEERAEELFIEAGGTMAYRTDADNEEFILTYSPIVGREVKVDGKTGDYLTEDGEVLDLDEVQDKRTEIDLDMGAPSPDKLDEPIDRREDRDRIEDKVKEVVDSLFEVEGELSNSGGSSTRSRGNVTFEHVRHDYDVDDPRIELSVGFETEYGYLYEIRVNSRGDDPLVALGGEEYTKEISKALAELEEDESEENFEQVGRMYLEKLAPEFVDYLDYDISLESDQEDFGDAYRLRFPMKAYGIPLSYSSLELIICQDSGKLSRFNARTPITGDYIEKPEDVVSEKDALERYLEETKIEPNYDNNGDFVFEYDNKEYNRVNAVTGELVEGYTGEVYEFPEITAAQDEHLIEWMSVLGIFMPDEDQVIDAKEMVSRGEAARVISALTDTPYPTTPGPGYQEEEEEMTFTDVTKDHPDYHAIKEIYDLELIPESMLAGEDSDEYRPEQNITREELAQMIVKTMNMDVITRKDDEMEVALEIKDRDEIDDKLWNDVALVVGLDILPLEDSKFRPKESLTKNEMAQVFDRLIDLGRFVQ
ncbi:S-layer homology domain-containing protein [Natranaerobius thermophilus]|uniref:S-layer domain protein n=1 Tax=Natranaerobius thermophilus (strain ATCC BAA-1301 / DSM 18059 / JW/NM-WN-LF) TaxID=457570 RepID=B2A1S1_NATTJ|nr:S-layer homology domain-containing protein [Natranaerobius thermophilus]ACB86118.1 S-layer domain protein [Natranaerobius thermophilus JW/NM-WN-LF]